MALRIFSELPRVRCAKMVILSGSVSADEVARIQKYLINPVDSRLASAEIPETLEMKSEISADIPTVTGFIGFNKKDLDSYREKMGACDGLGGHSVLAGLFQVNQAGPDRDRNPSPRHLLERPLPFEVFGNFSSPKTHLKNRNFARH